MEASYSSDDSSSSSESTSSHENDEIIEFDNDQIHVPQTLCENYNVFREFFSLKTWNLLPAHEKKHLRKFLPEFPSNDDLEKNTTLYKLLSGDKIGFNNPLNAFFSKLKSGHYRQDMTKLRKLVHKSRRIDARTLRARAISENVKDVLAARQFLLTRAGNVTVAAYKTTKLTPPPTPPHTYHVLNNVVNRTKRRYFNELAAINRHLGEEDTWSPDENYQEGPDVNFSMGKNKRKLNVTNVSSAFEDDSLVSSLANIPERSRIQPNEVYISDDYYRYMLLRHKRLKCDRQLPSSKPPTMDEVSSRITIQPNDRRLLMLQKQNEAKLAAFNKKLQARMQQEKEAINRQVIARQQKAANEKVATNKTVVQNGRVNADMAKWTSDDDDDEPHGSPIAANDDDHIIDVVSSDVDFSFKPQLTTHDTVDGTNGASFARSTPKTTAHVISRPVDIPFTPTTLNLPKIDRNSSDVIQSFDESSTQLTQAIQSIEPSLSDANLLTSPSNGTILGQTTDILTSAINKTIQVNSLTNQSLIHVGNLSQYGDGVKPATLSDLEGIDMFNIPVDLADDTTIDILDEIEPQPEPPTTDSAIPVQQGTHLSFFSVMRDIICSNDDDRMCLSELERRTREWQTNPISSLNDWYTCVDSWCDVLGNVVNFLKGDFTEQPDNFVPYVELKPVIGQYQWIGAGRDSDVLLRQLFEYWLEHRDNMQQESTASELMEQSDLTKQPPPPRYPTKWIVRKATAEQVQQFREQERVRYENPHKAFTYRMHGYESVVGPVKGIYTNHHTARKSCGPSDRPNFVTKLTLVRDATARLPNGEGTRSDICELLRSSQYIPESATDAALQSIVSGALDRMHTEFDPCVKYDMKRKTWIYLHRNRSETDFEKIHQQYQGVSKYQKKSPPKKKTKKPVTGSLDASASPHAVNPTSPTHVNPIVDELPPKQPSTRLTLMTSEPLCATSVATTTRYALDAITPVDENAIKSHVIDSQGNDVRVTTHLGDANKPLSTEIMRGNLTDAILRANLSDTILVIKSENAMKPIVNRHALTHGVTLDLNAQSASIRPGLTPSVTTRRDAIDTTPPLIVTDALKKYRSPATSRVTTTPPTITTTHMTNVISTKQYEQMKASGLVRVVTAVSGDRRGDLQPATSTSGVMKPKSSVTPNSIVKILNAKPASNQFVIKTTTPTRTMPAKTDATSKLLQTLVSRGNQTHVNPTQIIQVASKAGNIAVQKTVQRVGQTHVIGQTVRANASGQTAPVQTQRLTSAQQQAIIKQVALQQLHKQLQSSGAGVTSASTVTATTTNLATKADIKPAGTSPLVAKVLTNSAGQVISIESLLAHQKQHGSLPHGTTLRVSGGKLNPTNVIQLTSTASNLPQFAVVSTAASTPRLISSQALTTTTQATQIFVAKGKTVQARANPRVTTAQPHTAKITQQVINAKFLAAQGKTAGPSQVIFHDSKNTTNATTTKLIGKPVASTKIAPVSHFRMVNSSAINFAQLQGKPILLASKNGTIQGLHGQNIILRQGSTTPNMSGILINQTRASAVASPSTSTANQIVLGTPMKLQKDTSQTMVLSGATTPDPATHQRVVLATPNHTGQMVTQQILLPQGFQGGTISIKSLQGLKVIPVQQQTKTVTTSARQVFTRVINPSASTSTATTSSTSNHERAK